MKQYISYLAYLALGLPVVAFANTPPTISFVSPTNGATVTAGSNVTVQASAHDVDGDNTITKVEFWIDNWSWFGMATQTPYQATYKNFPAGSHTLIIRATDTSGATATSSITVNTANVPPTIGTISPSDGAHVPMDTDLLIQADVHDANGDNTISKVEFWHDNYSYLGGPTASPYKTTYAAVPSGTHTLIVRATDSSGAQTQTSVTIYADQPALYPDLVPSNVFYSNGVYGVTVQNKGTLALAAGKSLTVAFSADGTQVATATYTGGIPIGGSAVIRTGTVTPKLSYAAHTLSATVDPSSTIKELDKTNNTVSATETIVAQPDLFVKSFAYNSGAFTVNVGNRGDADVPAGTNVRVGFYISGALKGYAVTSAGIPAGSSLSFDSSSTGTISIPSGTYSVTATVDDQQFIAESDETNNSMTETLAKPDAPTDVLAAPGNGVVSVSFAEPDPSGGAQGMTISSQGSMITQFTVKASNGVTATGTSSPIFVTGLTNGTPYTFTVTATNAMGSATSAVSNSATPAPLASFTPSQAQRPSANTGTGFFVVGSKLYDPNGVEFRIRGFNRNHYDVAAPGIPAAKANTVRSYIDFTKSTSYNLGIMQGFINEHIVPIAGNWKGTCSQDPAVLTSIVDTWVAQASAWTTLNGQFILNIANEWGPANSTIWRDSYITAVKRLRAAGYTGLLSITSGGCGQDVADLATYAKDVLAADPLQNVIFDLHVYGGTTAANIASHFDAVEATGLAVMVGEFGPGRNIGPSPTLLTPGDVITQADAHGFGWMSWSWDDNNSSDRTSAAGRATQNYGFLMSYTGSYTTSSDLTIYGQDVVENPAYGLKVKAVPQTAF